MTITTAPWCSELRPLTTTGSQASSSARAHTFLVAARCCESVVFLVVFFGCQWSRVCDSIRIITIPLLLRAGICIVMLLDHCSPRARGCPTEQASDCEIRLQFQECRNLRNASDKVHCPHSHSHVACSIHATQIKTLEGQNMQQGEASANALGGLRLGRV